MTTATAYDIQVDGEQITIRNSAGKSITTADVKELAKFLRFSTSQTIRVMWDLDSMIAPVLKKMPVNVVERLSRFDNDLRWEGHELYYLPGRLFRIGMSRFYDIREFFGSFPDYTPELAEVQQKADELLIALGDCGLPNPRKLTSPIAVFEDSSIGRRLYDSMPKGYDITVECQEMIEYANKADRKDWVSNHYIGNFNEGEIWDYDISACYPSIASQLPDLRDLNIWKSNKYGDKERHAVFGFIRGSFTLDPKSRHAHCSPIMSRVEDLPSNPMGNLPEDYYISSEIKFIEDTGIGTFRYKDGWFAELKDGIDIRYPFRDIMGEFYQQRHGSPLANSIMKGISNSLIGKLIETKVSGEYGPLRNDIYHALITAGARIRVAQFLIDNDIKPRELVCIQTDGCRLTRQLDISSDKGLGEWRCNGSMATLLLSPYKVYSGDKKPYRLTRDDIVKLITDNPGKQRYETTVKHRLTLVEAIRHYNDITAVGELIDRPDSIELIALDMEQNRVYDDVPTTGQELLNGKYFSEPVILT